MKYRVLVVDDSVVMRQLLRQSLERDPEFEVAGVAANGKIALAMVEQYAPDAITLDIDMPELDGLQTLRALRASGKRTPVIMFSTLTERGALATLDALAAGADDYATKPADSASSQESVQRIGQDIIPKIKSLCWRTHGTGCTSLQGDAPNTEDTIQSALPPKPANAFGTELFGVPDERIEVVAIGASTGGPNALAEVLRQIPADFLVPIVIVQHMPPTFTRFLAERLSAVSTLSVREAVTGAPLEPGQVWVAPGDFHMELRRETGIIRLGIHQAPPENSCRPSVDVLFRSVARHYRNHALAVMLTGMGQDGFRGCEHIKEAHGQVIAQDEATSVVWGMPGYVTRAGLAERVLPLGEIAGEIVRRVLRGRRSLFGTPVGGGSGKPDARLAQGVNHGA